MVGAGSAGCMVDMNKTGFQWLELVVLVVLLLLDSLKLEFLSYY